MGLKYSSSPRRLQTTLVTNSSPRTKIGVEQKVRYAEYPIDDVDR